MRLIALLVAFAEGIQGMGKKQNERGYEMPIVIGEKGAKEGVLAAKQPEKEKIENTTRDRETWPAGPFGGHSGLLRLPLLLQ